MTNEANLDASNSKVSVTKATRILHVKKYLNQLLETKKLTFEDAAAGRVITITN